MVILAGSGNATSSPAAGPAEDVGTRIQVAVWVLTTISGLFLALRLHCKFLKSRGLWWDDHVLMAAWVRYTLARLLVAT